MSSFLFFKGRHAVPPLNKIVVHTQDDPSVSLVIVAHFSRRVKWKNVNLRYFLAECLRSQLRRSASAVDSAIAPDHLRNTQPLTILPAPPLVGECRSVIVICHFYSVGEHSSAWCPTSSHEPTQICQESRPSNTTVLAVADCKKPKYTAVGHRRRDAAPSTQRWDTAAAAGGR